MADKSNTANLAVLGAPSGPDLLAIGCFADFQLSSICHALCSFFLAERYHRVATSKVTELPVFTRIGRTFFINATSYSGRRLGLDDLIFIKERIGLQLLAQTFHSVICGRRAELCEMEDGVTLVHYR